MRSTLLMSVVIILLAMVSIKCAYKTVAQDCSPAANGTDWVCNKSIWSK